MTGNRVDDPRILRWILRAGAGVFGLSAVWLLITPGFFLELLALEPTLALRWSMWMSAITLIALTGNMAIVSYRAPASSVVAASAVMMVSSGALGFVTLLVPAAITGFGVVYGLLSFGFSAAYFAALARWLRPGR